MGNRILVDTVAHFSGVVDHLADRNVEAYRDILTKGKSMFEPAARVPYTRL